MLFHWTSRHRGAADIWDIPAIDVFAIYRTAINGLIAGEEVINGFAGIGVFVHDDGLIGLIGSGGFRTIEEFLVMVGIGR